LKVVRELSEDVRSEWRRFCKQDGKSRQRIRVSAELGW
jgi:hypothetical protein